jgi:hypothetical protein
MLGAFLVAYIMEQALGVGCRLAQNRLSVQSSGCPAIGNDPMIIAMNQCAGQAPRRNWVSETSL